MTEQKVLTKLSEEIQDMISIHDLNFYDVFGVLEIVRLYYVKKLICEKKTINVIVPRNKP